MHFQAQIRAEAWLAGHTLLENTIKKGVVTIIRMSKNSACD